MLFFAIKLSLLILLPLTASTDLRRLVKLARYASYLKYIVITNMVLFVAVIFTYHLEVKKYKRINRKSEENNVRLRSAFCEIENERSEII